MAAEFESGFMTREKAWHGLGTIVQESPTSADALKLAGLDWKVVSQPIYVGNKEVVGYKANVRDSDNSVLGIVKDKYTIVQNSDAFAFTDALLGQGVTYETAGSLRSGKTIWLLAKMDSTNILGDKIEPYLCFSNTFDGSSSVKVCMTDVRVVCNNTLSFALSKAPRVWSVRHVGDIMNRTIDARETLNLANKYNNALGNFAEEMVKEKLSDNDKNIIIDNLFPVNDDMSDRQKASIQSSKDEFMVCMYAPDLLNFVNTRWQIAQAAADFVSHKEPKRQTSTYQENTWSSLIFGNYFLDKTVDLITNV